MKALARPDATLEIDAGRTSKGDPPKGDRDPAIVVRGLSKTFWIPDHKQSTLKERVLHPRRQIDKEEIRAARDVTFTIGKGEFFGIVGRNGSGKSTLLKLLTGIYRPDSGELRITGRVSPLIELGVGFNPEMEARDNVLLNGTLLGLTRSDALSRLDETLEFAGLERFKDLKLKNYSSGMLTRLAFSIAINVDADVLLLDEVLAVGDAGFQEKCFDAFRRLKKEGKTIVLVTHDMIAVRRFADRALMLEGGEVSVIGEPDTVAERYRDMVGMDPGDEPAHAGESNRFGDGAADIESVWIEDEHGARGRVFKSGGRLRICAEVQMNQPLESPPIAFVIRGEDERNVFSAAAQEEQISELRFAAGDRILVSMEFENYLGVGTYDVTACIAHRDRAQWADARRDVASFSIRGDGWTGAAVDLPHSFEIVRRGS